MVAPADRRSDRVAPPGAPHNPGPARAPALPAGRLRQAAGSRRHVIAAEPTSGCSRQYCTSRGRYSGSAGQATPVPARSAWASRTS